MRVKFHRSFKKQYKKIPVKVRRKFDERLLLFEKEPLHPILNNHSLSGDRVGQWTINVTGDWRAVYIFLEKNTISFIEINTHSNLYV